MPDIDITITIPSDKVAKAQPWFLAEKPMPQIEDPANPGTFIDEYTVKEWLKIVLIDDLKAHCHRGKDKLDLAAAVAAWDDGIAV